MSKEIISCNKIDGPTYINNARFLYPWVLMVEYSDTGGGGHTDKSLF